MTTNIFLQKKFSTVNWLRSHQNEVKVMCQRDNIMSYGIHEPVQMNIFRISNVTTRKQREREGIEVSRIHWIDSHRFLANTEIIIL